MSDVAQRHTAFQKTRDFYRFKKGAPILQKEFGYFGLDRWIAEGHIKRDEDLNRLFGFDADGIMHMGNLGWTTAAFCPAFEEAVLEDRGDHELVRDAAGRHVLYFKGRRSGFMPEYVDHPVKDQDSWQRDVKWRLDPKTPERFTNLPLELAHYGKLRQQGLMIGQSLIGGYMYLRSLCGPVAILYLLHDEPELVHEMMRTWFDLSDAVIARHQSELVLDEIYLAEDICYNHGSLISPDMIREFLFPYYQQLLSNVKKRQRDSSAHLFFQLDTDGDCRPVIPLYQELGMDYISPLEVASGCDVVALRKQYPQLLLSGGIDKRILAAGKDAIDREIDRIMPFMKEQGGYLPTCDHGVPEEVRFEDYMHYRQRMQEF